MPRRHNVTGCGGRRILKNNLLTAWSMVRWCRLGIVFATRHRLLPLTSCLSVCFPPSVTVCIHSSLYDSLQMLRSEMRPPDTPAANFCRAPANRDSSALDTGSLWFFVIITSVFCQVCVHHNDRFFHATDSLRRPAWNDGGSILGLFHIILTAVDDRIWFLSSRLFV